VGCHGNIIFTAVGVLQKELLACQVLLQIDLGSAIYILDVTLILFECKASSVISFAYFAQFLN